MSGIPEEAKLESAPDAKPLSLTDLEKKERERIYNKKYRELHKEEIRIKQKEWRAKNIDKRRLYWKKAKEMRDLSNKKFRESHREKRAADSRRYYKEHPESTRDSVRRRKAILRGTKTERFSSIKIFERDNWICGICHKKVDKMLRYPDPMSVSIDHIVPISRGGTHTKDNVQCSHLSCNVRIKTRGVKQLLLPGV